MDTTTVLEIIKMIDTRIDTLREECYNTTDSGSKEEARYWDRTVEITLLGIHLQEFIEAQVSTMENRTEQ